MLIALYMIFARRGGALSMSFFEAQEADGMQSLSVVPLATPIIAGPGAMGGAIVVSADAHGDPVLLLVIVGVVVATMLLTLALLLVAVQLSNFLGATAVKVVTRVFGVILAALATQFAFNGIAESGIFSGLPPV